MASLQANDFVERVRTRVDIVDLVSESVPLKRAGRRFRGLCPFHDEKTPSFSIDPDKGLFYCFGCQTGGDIFKFVMLREGVDFLESARVLARKVGVPVPEGRRGQRSDREAMLNAHKEAASYYHDILKSGPQGAGARKYLRARGITGDTVARLEMGFAPESWDALKGHLVKKGYAAKLLASAGLLSQKEDQSSTYDRFRNRVVFPIRSLTGDVIGFGGRILGEGEPKYLNSADTPIYNKRANLYGLDQTRSGIRDAEEAILVEGYLDLASLLQAGIDNVVAGLGTAFAEDQVRLLHRFTQRVVINYDPDTAGAAATRRTVDILLRHGFKVRVLQLPGGKDPDDFVREQGVEAYRQAVKDAPRYFDYLLEAAIAGRDVTDHEIKSSVLKEILPVLTRVPDRIERSGYVNMLADRLAIDDQLMLAEIRDGLLKETRTARPTMVSRPSMAKTVRLAEAEGLLLRALLQAPYLRDDLLSQIGLDDLSGSAVDEVVRAMRGLQQEGIEISFTSLSGVLREPIRSSLAMLAMKPGPGVSPEEALKCVETIRLRRMKRERTTLQKEMEAEKDAVRLDELMRRKIELSRQIDAMA